MKCSRAIYGIIGGAVVLLITVLAVSLFVIFEIHKSLDEEGRYIYAAVVSK